jgi:hypothetical protein
MHNYNLPMYICAYDLESEMHCWTEVMLEALAMKIGKIVWCQYAWDVI